MKIYIFLIIMSLIFSMIEITSEKKRSITIIPIIILSLLLAFNTNNFDYENYKKMFENPQFYFNSIEKGYLYLIIFLGKIFNNFQVVYIILGIFFLYVLFKYKNNYMNCMFLMYFSNNFLSDLPQIRNMFVTLYFSLAFRYLVLGKNFLYIIIITIAVFFHKIAYLFFIFYIFNKIKKINTYVKLLILCFIFCIFLGKFFDIIVNNIFFENKLEYYLILNRLTTKTQFTYYLILILFDIIFLLVGNYKKKVIDEEKIYIKLILFPISYMPTTLIVTDLIARSYRIICFIKWFYYFKYIFPKNKNNRYLLLSILILNQIFIIIFYLRENYRETFINLINQLENNLFF